MPLLTASLGAYTVRRVGFGAMQLPGRGVFGPPRDHDQAPAVIRRAREVGVDHIDTASFYGPDVANALLAEALAPWDEQVRVVSKVGARRDDQAAWLPALSPEDIRASVAQDLAVLQRDRLTAVNLRLHEGTDDDTMRRGLDALSGLVDEGRVEHIGVSTVSLRQLELAPESAPMSAYKTSTACSTAAARTS